MRRTLPFALLTSFAAGQSLAAADAAPGPGVGIAMVTDGATNRPLLLGTATTWTWVHGHWRVLRTANHPGTFQSLALAGDAANGTTVLFGMRGTPLAETWTFDGRDWTQQTPPTLPPRRLQSVFAWHRGSGRAVLYGGRIAIGAGFFVPTDETWTFDGRDWRRETGSMPRLRSNGVLIADEKRDRLVLFSGRGAHSTQGLLTDTWEWDGAVWREIAAANSPPAREVAAGGFDPKLGRVVVHGGVANGTLLRDTWSWSGSTWRREQTTAAHGALVGGHCAVDPASGRLLLRAVGEQGNPTPPTTTWAWDGTAWTTAAAPVVPLLGDLVPATHDAVGVGVLKLGANVFDTAAQYRFDGADWHTVQPTAPVRQHISGPQTERLVHDEIRGEVLLYGEFGSGIPDQWLWNGSGWRRTTGPLPPTRVGHTLACDPVRAEIVLFGGRFGAAYFDDTWVWNGTAWSLRQPPARPSPRAFAAMAFGTAFGRTVLHGGFAGATPVGETWLWDGATWTQHQGLEPSARSSHSLCRWPRTGTVLGSGGDQPGAEELWEFDGAQWTLRGRRPDTERVVLVPEPVRDTVWFVGRRAVWSLADVVADISLVGDPCTASRHAPRLDAGSRPVLGSSLRLSVAFAPEQTAAFLFASTALQPIAVPPCTIWLAAAQPWLTGVTDLQGEVEGVIPVPTSPQLLGATVHFQAAVADVPGALSGSFALTNALSATIGN